jgi:hypothetical protein
VLGRVPSVIERVKLSLLVQTTGKRLEATHAVRVLYVFGALSVVATEPGTDIT